MFNGWSITATGVYEGQGLELRSWCVFKDTPESSTLLLSLDLKSVYDLNLDQGLAECGFTQQREFR